MKIKIFIQIIFCSVILLSCVNSEIVNSTTYNQQIKSVLSEINLLPALFYTIIDKPKTITQYSEFNKTTTKLTPSNPREKYEMHYLTNTDGLITHIDFIEFGIDIEDQDYKYSQGYSIQYDTKARISKIISESEPIFNLLFKYGKYKIEIIDEGDSKGYKLIFDFGKMEYEHHYKEEITLNKFELINPNERKSDIIINTEAQSLYTEYIYDYDSNGRLIFLINVHYDKPTEILRSDAWSRIFKIEY